VRIGSWPASAFASVAAPPPSKVGGSVGRGSAVGRETVNASSSSGSATASQATR
jgi:hypothetical protein